MPFRSVKRFVEKVQTFAADAYSNITSNTDQPGLATATQETSTRSPHADHAVSLSLEQSVDSMSAPTKYYTQSVSRFMDEFDPEQEDKDTSAVQLQNTKEFQQVSDGNTVASETGRILRDDPTPTTRRSTEKRVLGLPEKLPSDATKIIMPGSRKPFVVNTFRPQNTLDQPRSAQQDYYRIKTHKITPQVGPKRSSESQDLKAGRPLKKRRIDGSETGSIEQVTIDLDDSEDVMTVSDTSNTVVSTTRTPTQVTVQDGGLRRLLGGEPSSQKSQERLQRDYHRHESPDELLDDSFTKTARRQRVQEDDAPRETMLDGENLRVKKNLDIMLSSSPTRTHTQTPAQFYGSQPSTRLRRNSASRMEQRLQNGDESPDALQNDMGIEVQPSRIVSRARRTKTQSQHFLGGARVKHTGKTLPIRKFRLKSYAYADSRVPSSTETALFVDERSKSLRHDFSSPMLNTEPLLDIPILQIVKLELCEDDTDTRTKLQTNNSSFPLLGFEFVSQDVRDKFVEVIQTIDQHIKHSKRDKSHMDGVLRNLSKHLESHVQDSSSKSRLLKRIQGDETPSMDGQILMQGKVPKKQRLVDKLDAPSARLQTAATIIAGADRSEAMRTTNESVDRQIPFEQTKRAADKRETSSFTTQHPKRVTRQRAVQPGEDNMEPTSVKSRHSVFQTLNPWKKPLIYPPTGKKRETVHFDDLQRLDDDEFLNDNLVSIFIRYLEDQADSEDMKKIHFFNSFLIEALTKDPKARRGINFDAVKRWTVKVDLFSRDFVVVPVNENLHWFVMIICNLSWIKRKYGSTTEEEDDTVEVVPHPDRQEPEVILKSDLTHGTGEASARSSFAEMSLDDRGTLPSSPNTVKSTNSSKGRKRLARKSLPKYDVDRPVIITLDSLDQGRSSTTSVLRQYIVAEAKDKRGWEIEPSEIKGMTAKGIPEQGNFSDCGLYLCMYLEQFISSPYEFVRRILQRSNDAGWPSHIESSDLRNRLRSMLIDLHKRQHSSPEDKPEISPLGSILVKMEPSRPHLQAIRAAKDKYHRDKTTADVPNSARARDTSSPVEDGSEEIQSLDDWKRVANSITIDDDSQPQVTLSSGGRAGLSKSPYFTQEDKQVVSSDKDLELVSSVPHDNPMDLAHSLKRQRSPEGVDIDESEHQARSGSVTTEYLTGDQSYRPRTAHQIVVSPPRMAQNLSPSTEREARKSHQKFKKRVDKQSHETIDLEDGEPGEASGFNQVAHSSKQKPAIPPDQNAIDDERVAGTEDIHNTTKRRNGRIVLQDLSKNKEYEVDPGESSAGSSSMLV